MAIFFTFLQGIGDYCAQGIKMTRESCFFMKVNLRSNGETTAFNKDRILDRIKQFEAIFDQL